MLSKSKINYFLIIIISLALLSCKDKKVSDTKLSAKEIYDKNVNNTVTVVTPNGLGSGFFIDKNLIITNYHVIEGENSAEVILNNSDKRIKVLGYLSIDKVNDLILLKIDYNNNSFLEIENKLPSPGDKVFAIGSPIGLNKSISEGIVSGMRSTETKKLIQITTPISHGSSGCPIINENGRLIAVAVGGIDGASNIGFCIPSTYINSLIDFKESYPKEISSLNPTKSDLVNNDIPSEKKTINEEENKPKTSTPNDSSKSSEINKRFLGKHLFASSFIGDDKSFGTAVIKLINDKYLIDAYQINEKKDFIKLKGEIQIININKFIFSGNIFVYNSDESHETYESNENLIFECKGGAYWREQTWPDKLFRYTAYIDIFLKTDKKYKETNYP